VHAFYWIADIQTSGNIAWRSVGCWINDSFSATNWKGNVPILTFLCYCLFPQWRVQSQTENFLYFGDSFILVQLCIIVTNSVVGTVWKMLGGRFNRL